MIHETAESFLQSIAKKGGVAVSTGDMSPMLISIVQAHSDFYVDADGKGFGRLDTWNHPVDRDKQVSKLIGDVSVGDIPTRGV